MGSEDNRGWSGAGENCFGGMRARDDVGQS